MRAAISAPKFPQTNREMLAWAGTGGIALVALAYLFKDGISFISIYWQQDEYSHGWLIPLVAGFVIWQRRHRILMSRGQGAWPGVPIAALALALLLLGEAAQFQRIPALALVILLMGLGLAGLGWRAMRYLWVPLAFLLFAMPLPGSLYVPLTLKLQFVSSELGAWLLQLLGISVYLDGNIIDLGIFKLQVAEACSGLRYLFPLSAFGFLCAWLYKAPMWARGLVLLSIVPITIVMNSVRIALTGVFIEYGSIELAEGFMHLFEGWVIFIAALIVLFALMWLLARLAGQRGGLIDLLDFDRMEGAHIPPAGEEPASSQRARRGMAVPRALLAALLLVLLAVPAYTSVTDRQQLIPVRPGLVTFPLTLGSWQGQPMPIDGSTLNAVGADDHFLAEFEHPGGSTPVNLWVAYYDEQIRDAAIHSPKDCLPGGGWEYVAFDTVDAPVEAADGTGFKLNRGIIAKGPQQMLLYYWLEMRGRKLTNDFTLKFYNLWDSLTMQRSDGALVRLITPIGRNETPADADARLADFLSRAYGELEPHVGR